MESNERSTKTCHPIARISIIVKRRDFIKSTFALSAIASCLPTYLYGSNGRFSFRNSNISSDKIVIFVKMNGGNDGLNTLIPYQNSSYYDLRPSIAISGNELLV